MEMVCVIEESGEVTILETVEAVVEVLLMETSALCIITFIVAVEVGQKIPVNNDDSISDKINTVMSPFIRSTSKTPAAEILGVCQDSDHGDLLQYRVAEADTQLRLGRVGHEAEDVVTRHLRV